MNQVIHDEHAEHNAAAEQIRQHQFIAFLAISISIALFLVYIALGLYRSSGTLQLDLSRPGFDQAREEVTKQNQVFVGFAADGQINTKTLAEFNQLYLQELEDATAIDAFSGDALTNKTLQIPNN